MTICLPQSDANNWSFCPSMPAAILFSVLFALTSAYHIFQARKYRTNFCWTIIMGGLWETASFIIRNISIQHPTSNGAYTTWFLLFLLAPLWINAFDYMLLGRMVYQYLPSQRLLKIKAQRMTLCFVALDITSFIIQIGGGLLVTSHTLKTKQLGLHIYTGGLVLQESFIFCFMYLVYSFQTRLAREATLEHRAQAKKLLIIMYTSLGLISLRILYRILEFAAPFTSSLTQQLWYHEAWQYCLDATPMFFALIVMNAFHPGTIIPGDKSTFKPFETVVEPSEREKAPENSNMEEVIV